MRPRLLFILGLWMALIGQALAVHAQEIRVTSLERLYAGLASAEGGETFLLEGGIYGAFELLPSSGIDAEFSAPVTIMSANPRDPAVFTELDVRNARNMIFDRILFDYTAPHGAHISRRPFIFTESQNITVRNSVFDGDVARGVSPEADGLGHGIAITMRRQTGGVLESNLIYNFSRGIAMGNGNDARISGNELHSLRIDGMNFVAMQGIIIEDNYVHDFVRSSLRSDHADMIQFWTNRADRPSTDITIRRNVLVANGGNSTQSIFMRNDQVDRGIAGYEMFYRNVLIEENVIINGHVHGITLGETDGAIIRNNTLIRNQAFAEGEWRTRLAKIPRIAVADPSRNVVIENNIGRTFQDPRAGWQIRGNLEIQDISPTQPGYYQLVFRNAIAGDQRDLENFVILGGGLADIPGLGATLLRPEADRSRFAVVDR